MGFFGKNRQRNRRRAGHAGLIALRLATEPAGSRRMNVAARLLIVVFGLVFVGFVFLRGGQWLKYRLMDGNPAFTVRAVEITTDGVLTHDQIRRFVILRAEQNLYALDLAIVKRDLEMLPWIRHAFVERVLPATLRIQVEEREPVAEIRLPAATPQGGAATRRLLVDDTGFVMPAIEGWTKRVNTGGVLDAITFPQLLLKFGDVVEGRKLAVPGVGSAIELIRRFELSPMAGVVDLHGIDISQPEELVVTTAQGTRVQFAAQGFDRQLLRWREIHDVLAASRRVAATIDLTVTNHIPVIPAELSRQPETTPRPRPVRPPRRRNV